MKKSFKKQNFIFALFFALISLLSFITGFLFFLVFNPPTSISRKYYFVIGAFFILMYFIFGYIYCFFELLFKIEYSKDKFIESKAHEVSSNYYKHKMLRRIFIFRILFPFYKFEIFKRTKVILDYQVIWEKNI